jgi:hypothetical protein
MYSSTITASSMILLKVNSPSDTVKPFEGDAPRPAHVNTAAFRLSMQDMEVETRYRKIFQAVSVVQHRQPTQAPFDQIPPNAARIVFVRELGQTLMPEALDHNQSVTLLFTLVKLLVTAPASGQVLIVARFLFDSSWGRC